MASSTDVAPGTVEETTTKRVGAEVLGIRSQYLQKEFVPERDENYEVDAVHFSIMSSEEITKYSSVKICNKELYVPMTHQPMPYGVLDTHLGANKATGQCQTCGNEFQECTGHWGHIDLHHPVFHVGYFKHLINLLYCVCKKCAKLLLGDQDKRLFLQRMRRCHDPIMKRALLKRIVAKCKKEQTCLDPECLSPQGMLRRVMKPSLDQFMKIILQMKIKRDGPGSAASRTTVSPKLLLHVAACCCMLLHVHCCCLVCLTPVDSMPIDIDSSVYCSGCQ